MFFSVKIREMLRTVWSLMERETRAGQSGQAGLSAGSSTTTTSSSCISQRSAGLQQREEAKDDITWRSRCVWGRERVEINNRKIYSEIISLSI